MRLDSVVIDNKFEYPIEVQTIIGVNVQFVQPKALTWIIDDPTICSIEDGVLKGLANGKTFVVGQLGNARDTLGVIVEIEEEMVNLMLLNEEETADWTVKSSSNLKWKTTYHPATTEDNAKLTFTYSTQRAPYVQLTAGMRIYSLPKKIAFTFNPNEALFSDVILEIKANNAKTATSVVFDNITPNKEQTLVVDLDKVFGDDIAIYPLVLSYIKFNINTSIEKIDHEVDIKSLQLIYDNNVVVEYDNFSVIDKLVVYPNPATDYFIIEGNIGDEVRIYNLDGICVSRWAMNSAQCIIDASVLSAGTYIVKSGESSCKVIIK